MPESYQCRQSFFDQSHSRDVITKQSCGAAIRVKPKARLASLGLNGVKVIEPRRGDRVSQQKSS